MLGVQPFYFATVRKIVAAFGAIFTDITIQRRDEVGAGGNVVKSIKVPFTYAPKQKWLRITEQKSARRQGGDINIANQLPRMSYELLGMQYDGLRKLQTMGRNFGSARGVDVDSMSDAEFSNFLKMQLNPVPYDFQFNVYVFAKNLDDGYQIIEQILPFFAPQYTVTVEDIPNLNIKRDVPIIYNSISPEDTWEGQLLDTRIISWTLDFVAKGHLYPPISDVKIIKRVIANFRDMDTTNILSRVTTEVDPFTANEDDDWEVKTTIEEDEGDGV